MPDHLLMTVWQLVNNLISTFEQCGILHFRNFRNSWMKLVNMQFTNNEQEEKGFAKRVESVENVLSKKCI